MIHIKKYSSSFIEEYWEKIKGNVFDRIDKKQKIVWEYYFLCHLKPNESEENFFKDIITLPITKSCQKYPIVWDYFRMAFFASLNIKLILGAETSRNVRKSTRSEYIENYIDNNTFLNGVSLGTLKDEGKESDKKFEKLQRYVEKELSNINKAIRIDIDYKKQIERKDRAAIFEELEIYACPYCNRSYISNITIDVGSSSKIKRPLGDLDHFYSQNYFALFGLSLYNFIPSCKICNSLFKSDTNAEIDNPYEMEIEDNYQFDLQSKDGPLAPDALFGWNDDIVIKAYSRDFIDQDHIKRVNREINFFKIEEQYSIHKEYVRNFLFRKNMLDYTVKKNADFYMKLLTGTGLTESQIKEAIFGFDLENIELLKQPLAKLTKDLNEKY